MFDFDNMDLSKVCRSCLLETQYMKSLSDRYSTDVSVSDMFLYVTSLEFPSDYDGPPTHICLNCFHELSLSYIFVLKCRETNLQLRNHLDKLIKAREKSLNSNTTNTDSVKTEDTSVTDLFLQSSQNINSLNVDIKLEIENELDMFSNDLTLEDIDPLGGIEPKVDPSHLDFKSVNTEESYAPLLPICEMDQKFNLIKDELDIDLKTEIIDIKASNDEIEQVNTKEPTDQSTTNQPSNLLYFMNPVVILENLNNNIQNEPTIKCSKELKNSSINLPENASEQINDEPYSCAICNETFSDIGCLTVHIKTHKKEKPLIVRDKSSNYIESQSEVTGEKPFPCTVCDKSFNQYGNLKVHMFTHTGETPYSCTVCDMSFNHLGKLNHHQVMHTGVKPYTCKVCDKSFYRKGNLKRHMLGHSK